MQKCLLVTTSSGESPEVLVVGLPVPPAERPAKQSHAGGSTGHAAGLLKSRLGYGKGRTWTCGRAASAVDVCPTLGRLGTKLPLTMITVNLMGTRAGSPQTKNTQK